MQQTNCKTGGGIAALVLLSLLSVFTAQAQLTSTLSALDCQKLDAYYAPPKPVQSTVQASTTPGVFVDNSSIGGYIYSLNKAFKQTYKINRPNADAANDYDFRCRVWEMAPNNKALPLPAAPQYVRLDPVLFDQWWTQLNGGHPEAPIMSLAEAPPDFFAVPVPQPPYPVILPEAPVAVAPQASSPIGEFFAGSIYRSSNADDDTKYPGGYMYTAPDGARYMKFQTPFGGRGWIKQ